MNFTGAVQSVVDGQLERLRKERHEYCAATVYNWLAERAQKKPISDLVVRLDRMRKDIYAMTESMTLHFVEGNIVVNATGSGEQTLRKLKFGTDWFEPNPEVEIQIAAGLFKGR